MNCGSCGAPLTETSGRERMSCTFCGTIELIKRDGATIDGIIRLAEIGSHQCPSCEIPLQRALAKDLSAEMCRKCHGILFHRDDFVAVVWQRRGEYRGGDETPLPVNPDELAERRSCPSCRTTMDCHPYYGPGNAIIDTCVACDLVWLDAGELTTLERAPGQRQLQAR